MKGSAYLCDLGNKVQCFSNKTTWFSQFITLVLWRSRCPGQSNQFAHRHPLRRLRRRPCRFQCRHYFGQTKMLKNWGSSFSAFRSMSGACYWGPQKAGQGIGKLVDIPGSSRSPTVCWAYRPCWWEFSRSIILPPAALLNGEPDPGIQGWALYIHTGHKIATWAGPKSWAI